MGAVAQALLNIAGYLSFLALGIQLLGVPVVVIGLKYHLGPFDAPLFRDSGVASALLVPMLTAWFCLGVLAVATLGLVLGLINLIRPPRHRVCMLLGIIGNGAVASFGWFVWVLPAVLR